MKISIINIEWNSWNGFIIDFLNVDLGIKEGSLFCINVDKKFCYVDLFFHHFKLWKRIES